MYSFENESWIVDSQEKCQCWNFSDLSQPSTWYKVKHLFNALNMLSTLGSTYLTCWAMSDWMYRDWEPCRCKKRNTFSSTKLLTRVTVADKLVLVNPFWYTVPYRTVPKNWYMRKRIGHWCSVVPEKSQPCPTGHQPCPTGHQWWILFISHKPYQPVGKIKIEQLHLGRQVTSLLCQSDVRVICRILTYSKTSGSLFLIWKCSIKWWARNRIH